MLFSSSRIWSRTMMDFRSCETVFELFHFAANVAIYRIRILKNIFFKNPVFWRLFFFGQNDFLGQWDIFRPYQQFSGSFEVNLWLKITPISNLRFPASINTDNRISIVWIVRHKVRKYKIRSIHPFPSACFRSFSADPSWFQMRARVCAQQAFYE